MTPCLLTASSESRFKKLLFAVQKSVTEKSGVKNFQEISTLVYFSSNNLYSKCFAGTYGDRTFIRSARNTA